MSFQVVLYQYQPFNLEWPSRSKSFYTNTNRFVQNGHVVRSRFIPIPTVQFRIGMPLQVVSYQYQLLCLEWPCLSKSFYTNTNRLVQNGHVVQSRFIPIPTAQFRMVVSFQVVFYQYKPFSLEWPCRSKSFYTNTNRLIQNGHVGPSPFLPIPTIQFRMAMSVQVVSYQYQPFSLEWPCRSKSFFTNTNHLVQNGHVGPSRFIPIPNVQFRMAMSFQVALYQYQPFSLEQSCRFKSFYTNTNRLVQNGHVVPSRFIPIPNVQFRMAMSAQVVFYQYQPFSLEWTCRSKSFFTNTNRLVQNGHVVPSRFIPIPTVQFRMAMSAQVVFYQYQPFSLEWPCRSKSFYTNTKRLVQNGHVVQSHFIPIPTIQFIMAMSFQVVLYQYQTFSLEWPCRSKSFYTNTNRLVQNGHVVPSRFIPIPTAQFRMVMSFQVVFYQYQPFSLEWPCRSKSFYTNTKRSVQNGHVVPSRFIPIPTVQFRMAMSFHVVLYQYQPFNLEWPCRSKSFYTNPNHLVYNGHVVPTRFIPIPTVQFRIVMAFQVVLYQYQPLSFEWPCRSKSFHTNTNRLVQNGHVVPIRFLPIPTIQFRMAMSFQVALYQYQPFSLEWPCRSKSFYTNTNRLVQNSHVAPSRFIPIPNVQFRMSMSFQVVVYQYQPFCLEWPCRSKSFYTNTNRLVWNSHVAPSRFIPIPTAMFRMTMSFQVVLYQYQPFSFEWPCRSKSFYINTKRLVQNGHVVPSRCIPIPTVLFRMAMSFEVVLYQYQPFSLEQACRSKSFHTNTNCYVQNGHVFPSRFIPIPTVQFRMAMSFKVVLYQYQPFSLEQSCRSKSFYTNTNRLIQNGQVVLSRFIPIPTVLFRMAMSFEVVLYQYQPFSLEQACRSKSFHTNTNCYVQNGHVVPSRFIPIPTVQFRMAMSFQVVLYQYQPLSLEWSCRSKSFFTNTNHLVQNGHVVPSRFIPIPTVQFRMAMSVQVLFYQYQPFSLEWPCRSKSFHTNTNHLVQNGHVVPSRFLPIPTIQFRMAMSVQVVLYQYQTFSLEWPCRSKSLYTNTNRLVQNSHVVSSRFIPIPTAQFRMAMSFQVVLYQYQMFSLEWPCRPKSFFTNTNHLVQNGHVVPSRFIPIPNVQFRMAMSFQVVLYQYQPFSLEWPCRPKSFFTNTNHLVQNGHVVPSRFIPIPNVQFRMAMSFKVILYQSQPFSS